MPSKENFTSVMSKPTPVKLSLSSLSSDSNDSTGSSSEGYRSGNSSLDDALHGFHDQLVRLSADDNDPRAVGLRLVSKLLPDLAVLYNTSKGYPNSSLVSKSSFRLSVDFLLFSVTRRVHPC